MNNELTPDEIQQIMEPFPLGSYGQLNTSLSKIYIYNTQGFHIATGSKINNEVSIKYYTKEPFNEQQPKINTNIHE